MDLEAQLPLDEEKVPLDESSERGFPEVIIGGDDEKRSIHSATASASARDAPVSPTTSGNSRSPLTGRGSRWPAGSKALALLRRIASGKAVFARGHSGKRAARERVPPLVRQIHETPPGYPRFAAFLDSDDNFMVYRRFGYLQSRLLLEKQDDLRQLEEQLERMDFEDVAEDGDALMTREDGSDEGNLWSERRKRLLARVERTFTEYSTLLTSAQALTAMNKPTAGEQRSVQNWILNTNPVNDADASFTSQTEDLVTLRPGREHAWLDAGIEKTLQVCKIKWIQDLFRSKETRMKTNGDGKEIFYTRRRIERLVIVIITLMILVLLVVPIWILYKLTTGLDTPHANAISIGVLLVFTLAFSACISLFTRAQRHEILAASAAYCAVLVVFLGNVGGNAFGTNFGQA